MLGIGLEINAFQRITTFRQTTNTYTLTTLADETARHTTGVIACPTMIVVYL